MVQNLGHVIVPSTMLLSLQGMHFNDAMRKNPERPKIRILNIWQKKYMIMVILSSPPTHNSPIAYVKCWVTKEPTWILFSIFCQFGLLQRYFRQIFKIVKNIMSWSSYGRKTVSVQ